MRVAIYARVSTLDQQTLPLQVEALEGYAKDRGWTVAVCIKEVASGAKDDREGRAEALALARRRQVDAVLVWKLDRWGRSLADLAHTLNELRELGVGFVSLTEALDFTTPSGRAMAGLLAVFAEFERDLLRERVRAGIAQARAKGKAHGRPATSREQAPLVRELRAGGMSKGEIARRSGLSHRTVSRVLENRKS